ncbi:hypothetical protein J3R30DRAFT_3579162 [Lentinula aciculospora]|uniref:CCHC-type domain-containing protein n=1 Tax=Lentinula aciculospora TaxID=153920 RepID=A0A9W8ZUH7_9AGAR|nr:hypothetical protein J3R30DRAFT_3579162 [Lentinula aciculospora]
MLSTSISTRLLRVFRTRASGNLFVTASTPALTRNRSIESGPPRSQRTPQTAAHVAALPPIPLGSEDRPTPWLNVSEMLRYFVPLITSTPWRGYTTRTVIRRSLRRNPKRAPEKDEPVGNGLVLTANYFFSEIAHASEFAAEVKNIAREEKHHPSPPSVFNNSGTDATVKRVAQVAIRINTHEACVPEEISELGSSVHPVAFPKSLKVPGVTMRDIRFAMLVDQLFRDQFLQVDSKSENDKKTGIVSLIAVPGAPSPYVDSNANLRMQITNILTSANENSNDSVSVHPESIQMITDTIRSVLRARFCPCCGLPHKLVECPIRFDYPPRDHQTCKHCRKTGHWSVDCEDKQKDIS